MSYMLYVKDSGRWICVGVYAREFDAEIAALGFETSDTKVIRAWAEEY